MHRNLTVKEVLMVPGRTQTSGHVPKKQREQKVKQVMSIVAGSIFHICLKSVFEIQTDVILLNKDKV